MSRQQQPPHGTTEYSAVGAVEVLCLLEMRLAVSADGTNAILGVLLLFLFFLKLFSCPFSI
jgi:hypothetical protein